MAKKTKAQSEAEAPKGKKAKKVAEPEPESEEEGSDSDDSAVVKVDGAAVRAPSNSGSDDDDEAGDEEEAGSGDEDDEEEAGGEDDEDGDEEEAAPEKPKAAKKANASAGLEGQEEGDIVLDCRDCSEKFLFTVGEQEFFEQKGFDGTPVRCKPCRAIKKGDASGGSSGPVCFSFQKGECQNGDDCRYAHVMEAGKGKGGKGKGGKGGKGKGDGKGKGKGKGGGGGGVCYAFQKGECSRGSDCRFSH